MADVFFDSPPMLQGKEEDQLRQLQRYLNAMSDKLNMALMSITIEQMAPETRTVITKQSETTEKNYTSLKTMIVKTAEVVRHEMDEITARLEDHYSALSEQFGSYERDLTNTITATASGILQDYHYEERVQGLETDSSDNKDYWRNLNQYIFSGLIDTDPDTDMPRYGIAIGENVTAYDANNNPYLDENRKTATFTMNELAFWHGETKIAYFTDNVFHIERGEIIDSLMMGKHTWKILADGSMGLISG